MNEHLNPIFKEMLNNYFKGGRTEMNKDQKEILAIVMQYVDEPVEVIDVREISIEQLKEEMVALLSDRKTRYADEIATELKVDIRDVVEAFQQLKAEGKLFIDGDKL